MEKDFKEKKIIPHHFKETAEREGGGVEKKFITSV